MTQAERRIRELPATFTAGQARRHGVAPRDLYRMRNDATIFEISRGVFRLADASEAAHLDLIAVAARAPGAIVCLESALTLHDLIDDIPNAVHIAIARGRHVPKIDYPPVVVYRFDAATFSLGTEPFEAAAGEHVGVYNAARSVVDAMRLRHRIGSSLALHALNQYLRRTGGNGARQLLDLARPLNVEGPIRAAIEAVLA